MTRLGIPLLVVVLLVYLSSRVVRSGHAGSDPAAPTASTRGAAQSRLLLQTEDQREAFLLRANIATDAPTDGRLSWRAVPDDGIRRHDASVVTENGSEPTRRHYKYNVAAHELDKLLDRHLVPPSVERSVNSEAASVTWWLDDFAMNEVERRRKKIAPPEPDRWDQQVQAVRVFRRANLEHLP